MRDSVTRAPLANWSHWLRCGLSRKYHLQQSNSRLRGILAIKVDFSTILACSSQVKIIYIISALKLDPCLINDTDLSDTSQIKTLKINYLN
ncbi:uncharacterized protein Dyak_GE27886 [Drosophila yakuba]|uniref:Uncharacterized protein n=1 Tax=Drosophila yakuba TaxID=7245 RepID=A0A0R1DSB8_DROYA|nr:uncharacterized protein Dyak_GE27886 [Drosophila yakuba]